MFDERKNDRLIEALRAGDDTKASKILRGFLGKSLLRTGGANPNAETGGGKRALHLAVENGCPTATRDLMMAGADPSIRDELGDTPLQSCEMKLEELSGSMAFDKADRIREALAVFRAAINRPSGISRYVRGPATRLHWAVERGDSKQVEGLLMAGADPNSRPGGDESLTPFQLAIDLGRLDLAEQLFSAGANINESLLSHLDLEAGYWSKKRTHSALHIAVRKGNKEASLRLLEWGANSQVKERTVYEGVPGKTIQESILDIAAGEDFKNALLDKIEEIMLKRANNDARIAMVGSREASEILENAENAEDTLEIRLRDAAKNMTAMARLLSEAADRMRRLQDISVVSDSAQDEDSGAGLRVPRR